MDYAIGGKLAVRLRDGSKVYSAQHIADASRAAVPLGGKEYKTNGKINQADAINAYRNLLVWTKSKGVEPILLMTPYHENVLKAPESSNAIAIRATEPLVRALGHELDVRVIGSYDPEVAGCLKSEFYDFMHSSAECIAKLQLSQ